MTTTSSKTPNPCACGGDDLDQLAHKEVLAAVMGIKPGDHVCALYEYSPTEHLAAIVAYLRDGLAKGEQCVYIADNTTAKLMQALKSSGIDLVAALERRSLVLLTREQWRQPGLLDSIRKAAQVREILDAAFEDGFAGVRFAVEMTWTLKPDIPAESVERWEATADHMLASGVPVTAMCLYGRHRLPESIVAGGLRTHPLVLDGDGLRQNGEYRRPYLD